MRAAVVVRAKVAVVAAPYSDDGLANDEVFFPHQRCKCAAILRHDASELAAVGQLNTDAWARVAPRAAMSPCMWWWVFRCFMCVHIHLFFWRVNHFSRCAVIPAEDRAEIPTYFGGVALRQENELIFARKRGVWGGAFCAKNGVLRSRTLLFRSPRGG